MARRTLILEGPTFFSQGDEQAFFDWLQSISCVARVTGHLEDLHIHLTRAPGKANRSELEALVRRYRMNTRSLEEQLTKPSRTS